MKIRTHKLKWFVFQTLSEMLLSQTIKLLFCYLKKVIILGGFYLLSKPALPSCLSILSKSSQSLLKIIKQYRININCPRRNKSWSKILQAKKTKQYLRIRCFRTFLLWTWGWTFAVTFTLTKPTKFKIQNYNQES